MSLKLTFGKRQWMLLRNLGNGYMEWEDLSFDDKRLVLATGIDITDTVDRRKVEEFEEELNRRQELDDTGTIGRIINRLTQPLEA